MMITSKSIAFFNFEPADSPATKKFNLDDTEETTFPPTFFIASVISFRGLESEPVIQNVFPSKRPTFRTSSSIISIIWDSSLINSVRLFKPSRKISAT